MAIWVPYDSHKLRQYNGNGINFATGGDDIRLALLTVSYVPDRAADVFVDPALDLGSNEVVGTGYVAGGSLLAAQAVAVAANILTFDCDDVTFAQDGAGFTDARIAVLYMDTGDPTTSPLIAYCDMASDQSNVSSDLVLETPDGVFTV